jgi:hypothetical protein
VTYSTCSDRLKTRRIAESALSIGRSAEGNMSENPEQAGVTYKESAAMVVAMECPHCHKTIDDALIRTAGARLMNAARQDRSRDKRFLKKISKKGGETMRRRAEARRRNKQLDGAVT